MNLANGELAVILEGGHCFRSLAESASLTLRALLDYPNPILVEKLSAPSSEICETILNCIYAHRSHWKCLNIQDTYTLEEINNQNPQQNVHNVVQEFKKEYLPYKRYPFQDNCPITPESVNKVISNEILFPENCEYFVK